MAFFDSYLITARREKPTLDATIESLAKAGFDGLTVIAEPDSPPPTSWSAVRSVWKSHEQIGPWGALRKALRIALADKTSRPPASLFCVFQDDIQIAAGAADWLYDQVMETGEFKRFRDAGVISLYSCKVFTEGITEPGWHEVPNQDLPRRAYGALALAFSRASAQMLLDFPPNPAEKIRADLHVGTFCKNSERPWLTHVPSLVQHVGATSVAHPGAELDSYRMADRPVTDVREIAQWSANRTSQPAS